jgi:hypothetical protein
MAGAVQILTIVSPHVPQGIGAESDNSTTLLHVSHLKSYKGINRNLSSLLVWVLL